MTTFPTEKYTQNILTAARQIMAAGDNGMISEDWHRSLSAIVAELGDVAESIADDPMVLD